MEANMQIFSTEIISPSSKTPDHLKKLQLSYLDQQAPPVYVPLIFFYQADELRGSISTNHVEISRQLKQSMSKALTSFYPLAGRIDHDNFVVDCNDNGATFIEARVCGKLMDVVQEPDIEKLKEYLPVDPTGGNIGDGTLVLVQVTYFDCGGIVLGMCFSHMLADFTSIMGFVNAWAATTRGESEFNQFTFDLASHFPPRDFLGSDFWQFFTSNKKLVTKRLVFDKEKCASLKRVASSPSGSTVKDPTRVEVVSALIWKNFIEVAKLNNLDAKKNFVAFNSVNLRPRTSPPHIMDNIFGNCFTTAIAFSGTTDVAKTDQSTRVEEFHDLISKLRMTFKSINDEYIKEAKNGGNYVKNLSSLVALILKGEVGWCSLTSWTRFPVYEVDYGWGTPIWFCTTAFALRNSAILVDNKCGDGIEAWVNMNQECIEMLETQIKLI
ncbi:hypothetical protein BUALT_Bualt19G0047900 [Buddleja alternifolia]|uniref:Uncharacterized protein n=1 Tax=Buddleja alternifolia TaxID=168488 RepID=A0AAV6W9G3_9LAMI|nr:hypothetical protein BUALT_Bualt19G0047900 [Buddleja alternifolia]